MHEISGTLRPDWQPYGHNAETWEKPNITAAERFRYLYSEDELCGWVEPVRALAEQAEQVHVLMNNCYRDYAVRNACQLAALPGATASGIRAGNAGRGQSFITRRRLNRLPRD